MATGKQIRHYRLKLGWTLDQLTEASGVEVGTISALEQRDSSRSKFFKDIAKAYGLTLEQLDDELTDHSPMPPSVEVPAPKVGEQQGIYTINRAIDAWTTEAVAMLEKLSLEDRRAAVLNLRNFVQNLGPPRDGQTLLMAG